MYLCDDLHTISNQVAGVETNSKLSDHGNVSSSLRREGRVGVSEGGRDFPDFLRFTHVET